MSHPAFRAGHGVPTRIRTKLAVFGVLTAVAVLGGAPGWTILALAATTVAIPLAVALAGEPASPRVPVPSTVRDGVGHMPEQGDRAST